MRLDRYIFVEWLKVFGLTLAVILGLLLLEDIQNNLNDLIEYGVSTEEILRYYLILTPGFLPLLIPISLLVSVLFVLGQLHRNQEITAMRAAGLSIWRITRSLWVSAVFLTFVLFHLNAQISPWSVEQTRLFRDNYRFASELERHGDAEKVGLIYNLTFLNQSRGRMWFLNRFNEYNDRAYGVTVSSLDAEGRELSRLMASEAWYEGEGRGWTFLNGREIEFDVELGDPVRNLAFEQRLFEDFNEDPGLMKVFEKKPSDLSINELTRILRSLDPDEDPRVVPYAVRFYSVLLTPMSCLIVMGIAIPFAVTGVRANPYVGVSKAVGMFALYYVTVQVGEFFGRSGLNPLYAAALPTLLSIGAVVYFSLRATRPA